jgi:branched-chain amino acid transport system substrate-binding protein
MHVLVDAMKRADSSDPAKYLAELPKADYQGVTGRIRFDAKGDITGGAVTLYQVKDGKWQALETVQNGK